MMLRPRPARLAGLALAVTTPLTLAVATPVFAAGDSAVVQALITDGNVRVESSKGLSRVTVVLCQGGTVVADTWSADQLSGDVAVDGVVQAVFIHSGNNTTPAAQALLALLAGADAVKGDSTGAIAFHDADACDEPGGSTLDPDPNPDPGGDDGDGDGDRGEDGDGTGTPPVTTTDPAPVIITDPAPTVTDPVRPVSDPAPSTPDPSPPADDTPAAAVLPVTVAQPAEIPTVVLGETLVAGGHLPRTGAGDVQPLMRLALCLVVGGLALRAATSRRSRPASSPG